MLSSSIRMRDVWHQPCATKQTAAGKPKPFFFHFHHFAHPDPLPFCTPAPSVPSVDGVQWLILTFRRWLRTQRGASVAIKTNKGHFSLHTLALEPTPPITSNGSKKRGVSTFLTAPLTTDSGLLRCRIMPFAKGAIWMVFYSRGGGKWLPWRNN